MTNVNTPRKKKLPQAVKDAFFRAYARDQWKYKLLSTLISQFLQCRLKDMFHDSHTPILHKAESRAKSQASLMQNLTNDRYHDPLNVKDLAAARLIFFFRGDLERFAQNTDLVITFGTDAKETYEVKDGGLDGAGYVSIHFTMKVTSRTTFFEALHTEDQKRLEGLRCEVQMRTLFQHAWAETEHDLCYKRERVPDSVTRIFKHLAISVEANDDLLMNARKNLDPIESCKDAPGRELSHSSWEYKELESSCFSIGKVRYGYEMDLTEGEAKAPSIDIQLTMFDVDNAMFNHAGIEGFKQKLWDKLSDEEPQFMSTVTHDTAVVRVCGWDIKNKILKVQPAHYTDQVVTNHKKALDKQIHAGGSLKSVRDLNRNDEGKFLSFEESPFSNTSGVCCVLRVLDRWMISQRSGSVAYEPGMWGCSASGALEWTELGHWGAKNFINWVAGGIARELYEETGYSALENRFRYLGFGREQARAGKPQFFFSLVVRDKSPSEMEALWRTYTTSESEPEFKRIRFITDEQARSLVSSDKRLVRDVIGADSLSEELRTNLALALKNLA